MFNNFWLFLVINSCNVSWITWVKGMQFWLYSLTFVEVEPKVTVSVTSWSNTINRPINVSVGLFSSMIGLFVWNDGVCPETDFKARPNGGSFTFLTDNTKSLEIWKRKPMMYNKFTDCYFKKKTLNMTNFMK